MRKNGIDKLAFLVVLSAAVVVVMVAIGTSPAASADNRTDPAEINSAPQPGVSATEIAAAGIQPDAAAADPQERAQAVEPDGYEWSASRPADQRYLWSHRPN